MEHYHCFQRITHAQWVEEMLLKKYQKLIDTQQEQKDHHVKMIQDFA